MPICFVLDPAEESEQLILYSAIDEKPKRSADPMALARVRDILSRPMAAVLMERWDEDWRHLAWARLDCRAEILTAHDRPAGDGGGGNRDQHAGERSRVIAALRAKYPQYGAQRLEERPLIRLTCAVGAAWGDLAAEDGGALGEPEPDVEAM